MAKKWQNWRKWPIKEMIFSEGGMTLVFVLPLVVWFFIWAALSTVM